MPHHKVSDGIGSRGCALSNWMMGNLPNPQNTSLLKHPAGQGLSQGLVTSLVISKNIQVLKKKAKQMENLQHGTFLLQVIKFFCLPNKCRKWQIVRLSLLLFLTVLN